MSKFALKIGICGFVFVLSLPVVGQTSEFTDKRDGKKYRTVKIGKQTWMAENLNYETKISSMAQNPAFKTGVSFCYENKDSNCQKYGRLYDFNTAMKACPAGWRLSTNGDWDNLIRTVGSKSGKLKSKTGWTDLNGKTSGNATDNFGFSALPGGSANQQNIDNWDFQGIGNMSIWWVFNNNVGDLSQYSEYENPNMNGSAMSADEDMIHRVGGHNGLWKSVRCVKE